MSRLCPASSSLPAMSLCCLVESGGCWPGRCSGCSLLSGFPAVSPLAPSPSSSLLLDRGMAASGCASAVGQNRHGKGFSQDIPSSCHHILGNR